jgi:uncharacterized protein (TIGR03000 family)
MSFVRGAVLAAVVLLAAVENCEARPHIFVGGGRGGFGYFYPYSYGGYYGGYGYGYPYWNNWYFPSYSYSYAYSYRSTTVIYYLPPATSTSTAPAAEAKPAKIEISVPETAELWFDGKKSTQTGSVRQFTTPPLYASQRNGYQVRATWSDDSGAKVIQTRWIEVQPGERAVVDLKAAEGQ